MVTEKISHGEDLNTWKRLALTDTFTRENGLSRVTITDPRHEVILWDTDMMILRGLANSTGNFTKVRTVSVD